MSQQNPFFHRLVKGFAEVVVFNIIDQGAGVDTALTILSDDHFAEVTHEFFPLLGTQITGHTSFGDFCNLWE